MPATTTPAVERRNIDDSAVALEGYSPVSYVDDGRAERGSSSHVAEHGGVKYYLTDDDQRARFLADPDRYVPAFGGWCAFGMSVDKRFRVDPAKFKVVDGKLLLFLNDLEVDAIELWNEGDAAELLRKAGKAWDRFSGEGER